MKKQNLLCLILIVVCLGVFVGYRAMSALSADTQAPTITDSGNMPQVSVLEDSSALLAGLTARDDRDGDVTASMLVESVRLADTDGTIDVTCAAFDSAGNVSRLTRQARYTDYQSPRFSLDQPLIFPQGSGFDVLAILGAEDTLDGDIRHRIRATSLDDTAISTLGSHSVQFRVTNSLGDTAQLVLPVEVYTPGTYALSLRLTDYLIYLPRGSAFTARDYLSAATQGTQTVSLENGNPAGYAVKITGTVDIATPGVYTVDYLVTYTAVNQASPENSLIYTGFTRLIVVVEE